MQVSEYRFKFIKFEIKKNKDLDTTMDNERYKLNDVKELVNKMANGKIGKSKAI